MCIDNRKQRRLPDILSYILRTGGGGNIRYSEFKISYATGIGGVKHAAMIAHDNCGMSDRLLGKAPVLPGAAMAVASSFEVV